MGAWEEENYLCYLEAIFLEFTGRNKAGAMRCHLLQQWIVLVSEKKVARHSRKGKSSGENIKLNKVNQRK